MKRTLATIIAVLAIVTFNCLPAAAQQIQSGPVPITLNISVPETFNLACTPNTLSFTANGGTVQASSPVTCTTTWNFAPGTRTTLTVVEYFTNNQVFGIPGASPAVFSASVDGAASQPFSAGQTTVMGVTGYFGPSLVTLTNAGGIGSGTHTDTVQLSLNSGGLTNAGNLQATLNILALAQ